LLGVSYSIPHRLCMRAFLDTPPTFLGRGWNRNFVWKKNLLYFESSYCRRFQYNVVGKCFALKLLSETIFCKTNIFGGGPKKKPVRNAVMWGIVGKVLSIPWRVLFIAKKLVHLAGRYPMHPVTTAKNAERLISTFFNGFNNFWLTCQLTSSYPMLSSWIGPHYIFFTTIWYRYEKVKNTFRQSLQA